MPNPLNTTVARILALHQRGALRPALSLVETLLREYPLVPGLFNIRGGILVAMGQHTRARDDHRRALVLKPDFHQALHNFGNAHKRRGALNQALPSYQRATVVAPGFAPAHNNKGGTLRDLGRWREARQSLIAATRADPRHGEAALNLANSNRDLGDYAAANRAYRLVLIQQPEHAIAWNHLGIANHERADIQAAMASQRRALAILPDFAEAHRHLGNLTVHGPKDRRLPHMRHLSEAPTTSAEDRARLNFALGKAHDDFGDTDQAFAHFQQGNVIRKAVLGYKLNRHEALFARIKQAFSVPTAPLTPLNPKRRDAPRPIFIVGMPRSGTTLIEQILASHPLVHGAGELDNLTRLAYRFLPAATTENNDKGVDEGAPVRYTFDHLNFLRAAYLEEITQLAGKSAVVTDKMPTNFMWLGVIHAVFPNARIINLCRDPRAVIWSIYRHYFPTAAHGYAYSLADITGFHRLYKDLMKFWKKRHPDSHFDLHYEVFTHDPEAGVRALLDYCGLPWNDQCLAFQGNTHPIKTTSVNQVRCGIYQGSSDAWRRYVHHLNAEVGSTDTLGFDDLTRKGA